MYKQVTKCMEKNLLELHKNVTCCFKQIMAATSLKTVTLRPLIFHLKNIQIKHAGHSWRSKDKLMINILLWTPTHRCASKNLHELCVDLRCSLEDLLEAVDDPIYPTPPLGQDMTQGQFFKRSLAGLNSEFSFS